MAATNLRAWTLDEFLAWQERQEERYELVAGRPRLRSGKPNLHDVIVANLLGELTSRLRGTGYRSFTAGLAMETFSGQIRRADAGVYVAPSDSKGLAADVRLVAEVLLPMDRDFDTYDKLAEYRAIEALQTILVVEPNAPETVIWTRAPDGSWQDRTITGLGETIDIPDLGIALPLAEIYDGVEFPERFHYTTR